MSYHHSLVEHSSIELGARAANSGPPSPSDGGVEKICNPAPEMLVSGALSCDRSTDEGPIMPMGLLFWILMVLWFVLALYVALADQQGSPPTELHSTAGV